MFWEQEIFVVNLIEFIIFWLHNEYLASIIQPSINTSEHTYHNTPTCVYRRLADRGFECFAHGITCTSHSHKAFNKQSGGEGRRLTHAWVLFQTKKVWTIVPMRMPNTRRFLSAQTPPDHRRIHRSVFYAAAATGRGSIPRVYCHRSTHYIVHCVGDVIMPTIALIVFFSTRSISDVSWGKARRLTEWRNTPGRPGCPIRGTFQLYSIPLEIEDDYLRFQEQATKTC
jgi:hypothetical protein